jgi:hypothetical protein
VKEEENMSTEVEVQDPRYPMTAKGVVAQVRLVQEVMKAVMKKDTHYGVIPGCAKPSLWKPGAEVLMVTFRIASEAVVEDLSTADEARYRVTRKGSAINSGLFVGSAIGECSSNEEKYKWRFATCQAEYDATTEDRRREKYKRDGTTIKQVRTNHADVANTILKMADKRAYVALALNSTAASDCFVQDIEDLPSEIAEGLESGGEPARASIKPAQPKSASEAPADAITEPQAKRFYAKAKGAGKSDDEIKDYLALTFSVSRTGHIPKARYDEACAWADKKTGVGDAQE